MHAYSRQANKKHWKTPHCAFSFGGDRMKAAYLSKVHIQHNVQVLLLRMTRLTPVKNE